ncbi:MAG: tetratricopeptide repeat protein [Ignavibacteriaceae bacterium]|nr:tetratricopeptide repeat protein [Ignavibacteriaceae bacterium]
MKKIIFLLLCFLSVQLFASEVEEMLQKGNRLFRDKDYKKAVEVYTEIVNAGYESSALFYNLGNSYYRTGQLGYAILNYEKALRLSPGDADVKHNLTLANSKTADKMESFPQFFLFEWWEAVLGAFSLSGWTYTAYFFFIALLSSIGFYFFAQSPSHQKISLISGILLIVLLLFSAALVIIKYNREVNIKNGIVVENVVTVKQSPDEKSGDAFLIHEGLKVTLEDKIDQWIKIKLSDGKVGWLNQNDVRVI